jgi:hypothetical protein
MLISTISWRIRRKIPGPLLRLESVVGDWLFRVSCCHKVLRFLSFSTISENTWYKAASCNIAAVAALSSREKYCLLCCTKRPGYELVYLREATRSRIRNEHNFCFRRFPLSFSFGTVLHATCAFHRRVDVPSHTCCTFYMHAGRQQSLFTRPQLRLHAFLRSSSSLCLTLPALRAATKERL